MDRPRSPRRSAPPAPSSSLSRPGSTCCGGAEAHAGRGNGRDIAEQPQAFADARVLPLFPTYVWLHDLKPEDYQPINAAIVPKIEALIEPRAETIKAGIWQTNHDLHPWTSPSAWSRRPSP